MGRADEAAEEEEEERGTMQKKKVENAVMMANINQGDQMQ